MKKLLGVLALAMMLGEGAALGQGEAGYGGGLGIEVAAGGRGVRVVRVLPGSEAVQAGLRPGDTILSVDGRPLSGLSFEEAVCLLRGPLGSVAQLEVEHPSQARSVFLSVRRSRALEPAGSKEVDICGLRADMHRLRRHQLILRATLERLQGRQVSLESQRERIRTDAEARARQLRAKAGASEGAADANAQLADTARAIGDAAQAAGKQALGLAAGLLGGLFQSDAEASQAESRKLLAEAADIQQRAEAEAATLQAQAGELQVKIERLTAAIARLEIEIEVKDLLLTAEQRRVRSAVALERLPEFRARLKGRMSAYLDRR